MMSLNTGTAGAGKTLFTLHLIETRRLKDNKDFHDAWVKAGSDSLVPAIVREVYYFNITINKSKLPWIKLDKLDDWYTMPIGSIFFFDECQEAFEPMANSATRPKYYTELSKHRHRGYDMYFVTQHPTFVDTYVRKNAEEHNHYMRPFGAKRVIKHTWKGVKDQCDKSRVGSITENLSHPKEVYSWYKSSEVHTHKFKLPTKIKLLILVPILLAICVYFAYGYFAKKVDANKKQPASTSAVSSIASTSTSTVKSSFDPASFKTRYDDIPWSAPRYDELTKPTIAPRTVGCMVMRNSCKCMTQQGTYHPAKLDFCKQVIANGIFQDFEDGASKTLPEQKSKDSLPDSHSRSSASNSPPKTTLTSENLLVADSTFNLPSTPALDRYKQGFNSQPSGALYYQKLPAGGVMYRDQ
jgi:zona occludens toxin